MMRFANMEKKYLRKLDDAARTAAEKSVEAGEAAEFAAHRSHAWSVFILASTAVLREGIESIIFLAGVGSNTSFKALPLACLAGLLVGLAVGFIIYYGGKSIKDLNIFFIVSTIVLFFIAAGQVSLGTQLFSKVGMFGPYAAWADELAWQYKPVADLNGCCSDEFANGKQFFVLLHAVLGYQSRPSPIILIMYCFYWAVILTVVYWKWRNGSLFDADYKRKRTLLRLTRKVNGLQRKLNRCNRRIASLEAKLAKDAAHSTLQQQLDKALQQHKQVLADLKAATVERDAEQGKLDEEDRRLEAATAGPVAAPADNQQCLPNVGSNSSDGDELAATALIDGNNKDVETGKGLNSSFETDQQRGGRATGWFSKLRRKR
eukprot:GHRR01012787.1.p1 GENE.GHRR01012787.1~~GHRR01012787.1.p1  ORF type:complete len:375 (+),score=127.72 GHRR01012787.1:850-1974(+)